jgi:F-type H+-transporting ATPase subunit b
MTPKVLVTVSNQPLIDIDGTIAIQAVLFLVLLFLANKLLFQPYLRLRDKRAEGIEGARAEAERMTAEGEAKLADYTAQLAAARNRASDEQRKIRAEANAHEKEVTTKARRVAAEALEKAHASVVAQTEAARKELLPRAEALGKDMATRILGREVA